MLLIFYIKKAVAKSSFCVKLESNKYYWAVKLDIILVQYEVRGHMNFTFRINALLANKKWRIVE